MESEQVWCAMFAAAIQAPGPVPQTTFKDDHTGLDVKATDWGALAHQRAMLADAMMQEFIERFGGR